jgi:hypothetical protein
MDCKHLVLVALIRLHAVVLPAGAIKTPTGASTYYKQQQQRSLIVAADAKRSSRRDDDSDDPLAQPAADAGGTTSDSSCTGCWRATCAPQWFSKAVYVHLQVPTHLHRPLAHPHPVLPCVCCYTACQQSVSWRMLPPV